MRRTLVMVFLFLCGCSTYPLPEDVTAYNTVDLTTQVRCDARRAIQKYLFEENFGHAKDTVVYNGMTGSETKAWLQSDPKNYQRFDWKLLSQKFKGLFDYRNTIVGMDFTLDGQGQNDNGFSATLLGQYTKHTDTIGIDFGNTLTREVKRKYRTFDSFESLALRMKPEYCGDFHILDKASNVPNKSYRKRSDIMYPSTGAMRLDDLVHSFLVLNERENLGGTGTDWKTADMLDTITYTTKVNGNLSPSAELKEQALGLSLSKIGLTSKNFRLDTHTIIVDISLPSDTKASPIFDNQGFLALKAGAAPKDVERVSKNLDKAQETNFQDDFRNVATVLRERN